MKNGISVWEVFLEEEKNCGENSAGAVVRALDVADFMVQARLARGLMEKAECGEFTDQFVHRYGTWTGLWRKIYRKWNGLPTVLSIGVKYRTEQYVQEKEISYKQLSIEQQDQIRMVLSYFGQDRRKRHIAVYTDTGTFQEMYMKRRENAEELQKDLGLLRAILTQCMADGGAIVCRFFETERGKDAIEVFLVLEGRMLRLPGETAKKCMSPLWEVGHKMHSGDLYQTPAAGEIPVYPA